MEIILNNRVTTTRFDKVIIQKIRDGRKIESREVNLITAGSFGDLDFYTKWGWDFWEKTSGISGDLVEKISQSMPLPKSIIDSIAWTDIPYGYTAGYYKPFAGSIELDNGTLIAIELFPNEAHISTGGILVTLKDEEVTTNNIIWFVISRNSEVSNYGVSQKIISDEVDERYQDYLIPKHRALPLPTAVEKSKDQSVIKDRLTGTLLANQKIVDDKDQGRRLIMGYDSVKNLENTKDKLNISYYSRLLDQGREYNVNVIKGFWDRGETYQIGDLVRLDDTDEITRVYECTMSDNIGNVPSLGIGWVSDKRLSMNLQSRKAYTFIIGDETREMPVVSSLDKKLLQADETILGRWNSMRMVSRYRDNVIPSDLRVYANLGYDQDIEFPKTLLDKLNKKDIDLTEGEWDRIVLRSGFLGGLMDLSISLTKSTFVDDPNKPRPRQTELSPSYAPFIPYIEFNIFRVVVKIMNTDGTEETRYFYKRVGDTDPIVLKSNRIYDIKRDDLVVKGSEPVREDQFVNYIQVLGERLQDIIVIAEERRVDFATEDSL